MNLNLKGKTALVCGSTQGIGKSAAIALAQAEAQVILLARSEDKLKKVREELQHTAGQKHTYLVVDYNNPDTLAESVSGYIKTNGSVHILVNNTGGPPAGDIASAEKESFIKAFSSHLICNHLLAQACLPGMTEAGYGRIINVISTSVKQPIRGLGVSNTIRAAVGNWSKTLSNEVASKGITVNNVLPGATLTTRLEQIILDKSQKTGRDKKEIIQEMIAEIPAARFGKPEEIAAAIAFLASPAAAYINGTNIVVDGGRTACL